MSTPSSDLAACSSCGALTPLVCASCLKTRYCSAACESAAWAGHRASCAAFTVLVALPDEAPAPVLPAAPLASMEPAAGAGAGSSEPAAVAGSGFACSVCGSSNAAVCARCRLVGYCGAAHQRKDWPTHKLVCRKGEFSVVPVQTWEQRMLAEAHAAAPASLAATAALPPIPFWNVLRDGAPPTKVMRAWRKAAESGHAQAQIELGHCFAHGKGVAKDMVTAAGWFAKAAAQGNANGQCILGSLYESGAGVERDPKAAAKLVAKAAAQGDARAQYFFAAAYEDGVGVAQDDAAAALWYAKAAKQGCPHSVARLGACLARAASATPRC